MVALNKPFHCEIDICQFIHECFSLYWKAEKGEHEMVKSQQFFNQHRQQLVILTSILLILAEMARLGGRLMPLYQLLMAVAGLIGLAPILLTAISSLQVRLISIDVLVSIAVIGALIIGEFNEAAIVTWLFMLGEVLENFTLKKTRSAVKELASMAPQTATVIDDDGRTS